MRRKHPLSNSVYKKHSKFLSSYLCLACHFTVYVRQVVQSDVKIKASVDFECEVKSVDECQAAC